MSDASGLTAWSYDPMGRVMAERRTINGMTKQIGYTYNLDGSLATLTYPSGRVVTYAPSGAGRVLSAVDSANGINYAQSAKYAPPGALRTASLGGTISIFNDYNSRLQPLCVTATTTAQLFTNCDDAKATTYPKILSLSYNFDLGYADNGNVMGITNNRDSTRSTTYTYDDLNRLLAAQTTSNVWGNAYAYDIFGNLLQKNSVAGKNAYEPLTQTVTTKNQFTPSGGFNYDIAGNLTVNGSTIYAYDAENRLASTAGVSYTYDGDGERVMKSGGTLYWNGTNGPLAESDLSGNITAEYVFFNGKRIARRDVPSNAVHHYFSDHLGSADVVTSATGTIEQESDYYPFGGERVITAGPNKYKFTGKERDGKSGLDEFGARYYSSSLGRFMTPDWASAPTAVPYADFGNPQSLNLYGYVKNNPTTFSDSDGHCGPACGAAIGAVAGAVIYGGTTAYFSWKDYGRINWKETGKAALKGAAVGSVLGGGAFGAKAGMDVKVEPQAPSNQSQKDAPSEPYDRQKHYGNTPTEADRQAIGGESVDHKPPLVQRYYEGDPAKGEEPGYKQTPDERRASATDRDRMQPSTLDAQRKQGGEMSTYSKEKKRQYGLDKPKETH